MKANLRSIFAPLKFVSLQSPPRGIIEHSKCARGVLEHCNMCPAFSWRHSHGGQNIHKKSSKIYIFLIFQGNFCKQLSFQRSIHPMDLVFKEKIFCVMVPLGDLIFCLSTLYGLTLYFFVCTTLTLLKFLQWMSPGNFTKIQGKPKILRRQWNVKGFFGNNPCLQHFSDCLLTLLTCRKDGTLFKWYRNIPHKAETFWKIKELSGQSENFPDTLESFNTIWKLSRHSGNFPDNMESVHKIWKFYRQPGNFLDNQ